MHQAIQQALIKQLQICIRDRNAERFIELCRAAQASEARQNQSDNSSAKRPDGQYLEELGYIDPEFLVSIVDAFPTNHFATLRLLGSHAGVDQAIIDKKIDLQRPLSVAGSQRLVEWGIKQKNLGFIEAVITNVCQHIRDRHANNDALKHAASDFFIQTLVYQKKEFDLISPIVDAELSSIVTPKIDKSFHPEVVGLLAKMRMGKTLIAMLEHGRLGMYLERHHNFSDVRACLPSAMTVRQSNAVLFYLEPKAHAEQILFDENMDVDAFIQSMRETCYRVRSGNDLSIYSIKPFIQLITPENFAVPARKARILKLLQAVCDAEFERRTVPEHEVRAMLEYAEVPAFTYKHIRQLRGIELEEAMGL
jgi:hypothetical protein